MAQRLTELEIKVNFQEDPLDQLDAVVVRKQAQIYALIRERIENSTARGQYVSGFGSQSCCLVQFGPSRQLNGEASGEKSVLDLLHTQLAPQRTIFRHHQCCRCGCRGSWMGS